MQIIFREHLSDALVDTFHCLFIYKNVVGIVAFNGSIHIMEYSTNVCRDVAIPQLPVSALFPDP